jgi:hypothetical protein
VTGGDWSYVGLSGADLRNLDPPPWPFGHGRYPHAELAGTKIDLEQAAVIATTLGFDVS